MNHDFTVQKKAIFVWKKKFVQRGSPEKKNSCTNSERKKKFLQAENCPPPHHFSNGSSLRGWGKERIWHLSKCHHVVVFKTKVLHFKIENYADKRHKWKEKVQKNAQFPFCGQTKAVGDCLSSNSTLFCTRRIGALGFFWTNQGSEVSEVTWGISSTLWSKKSTLLKENFCIFYISISAWKKIPQNLHLKFIFCRVLSRFNSREQIHDPVCVYAN